MRFSRGSEEFSRVLAFSDGMFAIAMTLLVVAIAVPELTDPTNSELLEALDELLPEIISFFISFAVIGRYWAAHHHVSVAVVSGLEVLLYRRAYRANLLSREMPPDVFRWGVWASSLPVLFMLLSVPVAFLNTVVAVLVWFLAVPGGMVLERFRPAAAADYW